MKTDFKPFQKPAIRHEDRRLGSNTPQRAIKSLLRASQNRVKRPVRLPGCRVVVFVPAWAVEKVQGYYWRQRQAGKYKQIYTRLFGRECLMRKLLKTEVSHV